MFEWIFGKKRINEVEKETKTGFEKVKNDLSNISRWIKHLNEQDSEIKNELSELNDNLATIEMDIEGLKNMVSILGNIKGPGAFKTPKQVFAKQTAVDVVQTAVQTAVQTPNLNQFSITERAIIGVLLNADIKLSYEDLAALLGKEKSTIRGQINSIKQKSFELVKESVESNGKKRVFIPEEIKEKFMKKVKSRAEKEGKKKDREEREE